MCLGWWQQDIKHYIQNGHSSQEYKDITDIAQKKWVINLSSTPLTHAQRSLLVHGPNFAVAPQKPPYGDYIIAIELACQSLDNTATEELRADIYRVLRHTHHPYITLEHNVVRWFILFYYFIIG